MSMTYRKATISDIELLAQTRAIFISEVKGITDDDRQRLYSACKEYFDESMRNDSFVSFLAFDGETLVGTSGICFYRVPPSIHDGKLNDGMRAYIQNMFTCPTYREQGIASHLFEMTIQEAKRRNCHTLTLNATAMGRPIYTKFGFTDTRDDMEYFLEE